MLGQSQEDDSFFVDSSDDPPADDGKYLIPNRCVNICPYYNEVVRFLRHPKCRDCGLTILSNDKRFFLFNRRKKMYERLFRFRPEQFRNRTKSLIIGFSKPAR